MKIRPAIPETEGLSARRARVRPEHVIRGIVFHAIERTVATTLGLDAVAPVKRSAQVSQPRYDSMIKYPMLDFLNFQEAAADALAPHVGGFDEAIARIGAAAVDSFFESIAGKTMALLAGRDPSRLLSAVPNGYGLLVSFGRREWKQTSPSTGIFSFHEEFLGPVHTYGTFDAALRKANQIDARFDLRASSPLDFEFHLSW